MKHRQRSALGGGLVLILVGAALLAVQLVPSLSAWIGAGGWPLIIVGVGVLLLLLGLVVDAPGLAVPACIVGGIGGLLLWQNNTGNWTSWAWAWTFILGFVGVGTFLMGLIEWRPAPMREGIEAVFVSLVLFAIFSSLFGGPVSLGDYWPVLLILLGLIGLVRYILGASRRTA